jgi:hypothetical protein
LVIDAGRFGLEDLEPHSSMPIETFKASRWTKGNLFFPTYIEVSEKSVTRRKRTLLSVDEESMSITKVASVHIKTGLIWSNIQIESSGGSDPITSHGHTKGDAQRIKELIENAQAEYARRPGTE